jgi:hypothetical protein
MPEAFCAKTSCTPRSPRSTWYCVETPVNDTSVTLPGPRTLLPGPSAGSGRRAASSPSCRIRTFSGRTPSWRTAPAATPVGPAPVSTGSTPGAPVETRPAGTWRRVPATSTPTTSPASTTVPVTRLERPRKFATNAVLGSSYSSAGGPSCSTRPSFMTATVSAMVMASSWSCVTCTNVMPASAWMRLSSSCISRRSARSSAPSGSSRSSTDGLFTRARARATRCCCPPESWLGLRSARCASRTVSSPARALARTSGRRLRRSPNATLSSTVMCGNSA